MRTKLLQQYERELSYMRQIGAEFATKYPAVAGRLMLEPDRCADPHVERLLESFAFLAARIHLRLDDDFPELTQGFLDVVYPDYLRPIPSMTVAEFSPGSPSSNFGGEVTVPRGSEITSRSASQGIACTFRTCYPVKLWPLRVEDCSCKRPELLPAATRVRNAAAVLRWELKTVESADFSKMEMDDLIFYLGGDRQTALMLYEMLSRNLLQIVVRNPLQQGKPAHVIEPDRLKPMGFDEAESMLSFSPRSFQGHRLLQEYFSFPEKFLFFQLTGLRRAIQAVEASEALEVLFFLRRPEHAERLQDLEAGINGETMRLFCTPAVNLFQHTAEPIVVTQTRPEYPVSVDAHSRGNVEVFSVDSVLATNPSRRTSVPLAPLFEHHFGTPTSNGVYWRSRRRYSNVHPDNPGKMYLSIADAHGTMLQPDAEILIVKCTCTNHDLPSNLPVGDTEGDFVLPGIAGIGNIRALHRPTRAYRAPVADEQSWSLISQLSLNHLSMGEGGLTALQEILRLNNFARTPHIEKQIAGILSIAASPHVAILQTDAGSGVVRGMLLEMALDESHFAGGTYLFSAVLDRFFGLYVSMNSFSQLVVRTNARKEALEEWPARAGTQTLL
ncbi:type VI secretion system protein ImpG [Granulicella aggregans]|uniref:Type VI secretion system protein ImpG n=1 Tax=Granulicella aggregans TaxID=474949 RepID=A0A7W8E5Q4_9BACT|nr:type VI secretion system baseplate subunit TssF [Granulicella aggregans]MBB5060378.1 type VI secretion system protein ImpG [Granulicella aggregans]